ncbi:MAG: hypothetical protein K2X47_17950 [Bdellovibrionales bacterium]|nr:hypothetical protein [Bdellovibrionales bacterium]
MATLFVAIFFSFVLRADPPTLEKLYPGAERIETVHEHGQHIVILATDFVRASNPKTKSWSNQKILLVIKKAVSMLRKSQLSGVNTVSSTIRHEEPDGDAQAFGVYAYQRALIARIKLPEESVSVLLDLKGTGTAEPSLGVNSNGLLSLPVAMKEFVVAHLIQKIFAFAGIEYDTVPHVAVSASDFFIKRSDGTQVLAAKLVRAPHGRLVYRHQTHFFVHYQPAIQIEQLLQLFGISSLQNSDGKPFLNIQGTPSKQLFDFGHYSVSDEAVALPETTFAYYNALLGDTGTVPHEVTKYFPKPIQRIDLIHNLLGDSPEDKIYGEIMKIYRHRCPIPENCDRKKLSEELSFWAQTFLNRVDQQLAEKTFTETVMEKLGTREGADTLAKIYPAFRLTKKGQLELQRLLDNPRYHSAEAPRLEVLRNHTDLDPSPPLPLAEVPLHKTNFIRNVSARFRKATGPKPVVEEVLSQPQDAAVAEDSEPTIEAFSSAKPRTYFCSELVTRVMSYFKSK